MWPQGRVACIRPITQPANSLSPVSPAALSSISTADACFTCRLAFISWNGPKVPRCWLGHAEHGGVTVTVCRAGTAQLCGVHMGKGSGVGAGTPALFVAWGWLSGFVLDHPSRA